MKAFISYSHIDSEIADKISKVLSENDVGFFLDKKDIEWGDNLQEKIIKELEENTSHLIPIISPASVKSQWVVYEIITAKTKNIKILPFLTHPSLDAPFFIKDLKYSANIEEIETYFKKLLIIPSLNLSLNFIPGYGRNMEFEDQMFRVGVDEKKEKLDLKTHYPTLTLEVVNNEKNIVNIKTPKISFIKPHKMCFTPQKDKIKGFSFGTTDGRIIPLRPKGKLEFTLYGLIFIEFYESLIKDNVESIKISDEANVSIIYNDIKKLKEIVISFFKHADIMTVKKNAIKDRKNFC